MGGGAFHASWYLAEVLLQLHTRVGMACDEA
jgi:hypothetical protein